MKKLILSVLCAGLMAVGKASADNTLSVADVTIPQGGQATMEIECSFDTEFLGFQVDLELNEDGMVTPNMNASGKPVAELGFTGTSHSLSNSQLKDASEQLLPQYRFICVSLDNEQLPTSGTLLRVVLNADASAQVGQVYQVKLSGVELTDAGKQRRNLDDIAFSITIGEPADTRVVLDENATTAPEAATGVDVRVKRTITAGVWNTICLPFAMTEAQVKEAFGNDVQLASFKGWETTSWDDDNNATGIAVEFKEETAIAANTPYIIKVTEGVSEFTVDGVTIAPEDEPSTNVGTKKTQDRGAFIGTYVAETEIEAKDLFLYDNSFWYSTGKTKSKAYRAYFWFEDILASYGTGGSARMRIVFNEATGVNDVKQAVVTDGRVYNLQGQRVENPKKGAYIKNGKVVIIK